MLYVVEVLFKIQSLAVGVVFFHIEGFIAVVSQGVVVGGDDYACSLSGTCEKQIGNKLSVVCIQ